MAHTIDTPAPAVPRIGEHWSRQSVLVLPPDAPREQWLAARRDGIGASDASAVLGISKWATPMRVWAEKTGMVPGDDAGNAAKMGHLLEPVVADWFAAEYSLPLAPVGLLRSVERPWQMATPDRAIVGADQLVEIKTTASHMGDEWADGQTPDHAELQVQHQLAVTGFSSAYVVVMIGGQWPEVRHIQRDEMLIADLNALEEKFWTGHVLTQVAPPATSDDADTLAALFPSAIKGKQVELPADAEQWIADYQAAHLREKEAKGHKKAAANLIRQALGDAQVGTIYGKEVVSWPEIETTKFDQKLMEEKAPKLYSRYQSTTYSRRLNVKG